MKNIAVFASGEGTNLQAIMDAAAGGAIDGRVALVVSNRPEAGALKRARSAGIPAFAAGLNGFKSPADHDRRLTELCLEHKADLVCLAGYMLKLGPEMLATFENRLMNVHPALLPSFGGKGMYGMKVHSAVLAAGARVSGATVHFVTEKYDTGPIISQAAVGISALDTPETLAGKVGALEHVIYPKAVALFCRNLLKVEEGRVRVLRQAGPEGARVRRALISVSDKTGAADFARGLSKLGVEIVSTSGTYKLLKEAGVPVRALETMTGFPEMLDGRVKTLHPLVHGGILYRRDNPAHVSAALENGIEPIDLVAVNLYPFAETAKKAAPWSEELIENIDIGGPAMLRAAAKNYTHVAAVTDPADYPRVIKAVEENGGVIPAELKKELALKTFGHTGDYDTTVFRELSKNGAVAGAPAAEKFADEFALKLNKIAGLRYGENPHQACALYSTETKLPFVQLQGKELSYNNILDSYGSYQAALEFDTPAAVIFKHVTPCGMGAGEDLVEAFDRAWQTDPQSAFGGIIAVNRKLDARIAEFLSRKFVEVICAPDFDDAALAIFAKKAGLRLLKWEDFPKDRLVFKSVGRELLISEDDAKLLGDKWEVPTARKPSAAEDEALKFAWTAVKYVRSNAIVLAASGRTVGIGAGQMSRVDSVHMAGYKYEDFLKRCPKPAALVMASDAFFPFPDSVETAAGLGVTAVIQPGGSVRDAEVIAAADRLGLAMVLTGIRHFRH